MKLTNGVKQVLIDNLDESFLTSRQPCVEEQHAKEIQKAIENGISSLVGCRVVEPKLWEERYF